MARDPITTSSPARANRAASPNPAGPVPLMKETMI